MLHIVDVSDTTDNASGTSKKITSDNLLSAYDSRTATLTNKTFDANGTGNSLSNVETADIASGSKSGSDTTLITGTAGTSGDLSQWNADGDLVDGPTPPSGSIVGTSDTQTLTNKTLTNPTMGNDIIFDEQADHSSTPGAGKGYLWVKNTAPSTLIFTDDTGSDTTVGAGGGGISNVVEDTTPQLGGQLDVNGNAIGDGTNELITFTEDASAVNQVNVENQATGAGPIISAAGDDTNIDLHLAGKGTGDLVVDGTATDSATIMLAEDTDNGTNAIGFKAPAAVTTTTTFTLPDGDGSANQVLKTDASANLAWSDVDTLVSAASTTTAGKIEVATAAETTTGTDATRAVSPDGLAGSDFGIRYLQAVVFDFTTDTATGDGKFYFHTPAAMDGMNLVEVRAEVITAGTTGTTDIQIHNVDNALDMLSTKLTIDSAETGSDTAATAAVINTSNDHVNEHDVIRIDVDAVSTTPAKGLIVTLGFQLP